jgi:hypothetical protein
MSRRSVLWMRKVMTESKVTIDRATTKTSGRRARYLVGSCKTSGKRIIGLPGPKICRSLGEGSDG